MMQNLDMISILFLLLCAAAAIAVFYSFALTHAWFRRGTRTTNGTLCRAVVSDSSLDTYIATQWTEGRLRLDVVLALIKRVGARWSRKCGRCTGFVSLMENG